VYKRHLRALKEKRNQQRILVYRINNKVRYSDVSNTNTQEDSATHTKQKWSSCAVVPPVGAVGRLVGVALLPPEDDRPRDGLEAERDAAERGQDDNVGGLPSSHRLEDVEPLEDVDGGQDDDRVPDGVVVDVPVEPVLVLLVGPQQQREHLERGEAEDGDADVAVGLVGGAHGLAAELEAQAPAGDAEDVARALAGDVEVEPRGVGGLEHAEVARDHGAQGDQDAPGHSVQHSVDLYTHLQTTSSN
jgi:hypothetical protein